MYPAGGYILPYRYTLNIRKKYDIELKKYFRSWYTVLVAAAAATAYSMVAANTVGSTCPVFTSAIFHFEGLG